MKISEEIINLVKDSVDSEAVLQYLGFKLIRTTSYELRGPCPLHGGDNKTAFSFRTDSNRWRCYTKKCERAQSGRTDNDIISIVRRVNNCSFTDAVQFLADFACLGLNVKDPDMGVTSELSVKSDMARFKKLVGREEPDISPAITEDQVMEYYLNRTDFFIKEGFSEDTLDFFEVGHYIDNKGVPRETIPIRDEYGSLLGMSARRVDSNLEPRYKISYGLNKDKVLYNYFNAKKQPSNSIILVEGFKACWAVVEAGYMNVAACMGAVVTRGQLMLLATSEFRDVYVMFDGDEAGEEGAAISMLELKKIFSNVNEIVLPNNKSPDDFRREELREIININGVVK